MHNHSTGGEYGPGPHKHIDKHKHIGVELAQEELTRPKIALIGNPNVGKSLFFNYMSGMYVDVSNYPGTTIEYTRGRFNSYDVFDTPGVYGISSFSDEEGVTRDVALDADIILNIVDAVHLERDLFLTQQLIDMGKKVAVMLNFMDEVEKAGLEIDTKLLSSYLGVPVFRTTATTKQGFDHIETAIEQAKMGEQDGTLHHKVHNMLSITGSEAEAMLVLEGDEVVAARHGIKPGTERENLYIERRNRVNLIINAILTEKGVRKRVATTLGRWAVNTWTGIPMLFVALYLIYLFVGKFVAQDLVGFTEAKLGHELWEPWIKGIVTQYVSPQSWLGIILVGEFGVVTMTVTYLLFLLLPLVIAFYLSLAILEDSGYLPRLATFVDRSLNAIGLNGSAVIPLILGFGCVTMATITTRLLGSEREKRISTAILQFAIPCSAQLAVVAALLTGAGFQATLIYTATIFTMFVAIGTILHRVLPGQTTPLLIDLPPMRLPRFDNVIRKTAFRAYFFMKEATPWFFIGALGVGIMQVTGLLNVWQNILSPFTVSWLQLPREAATTFVMGMVRRDFGAAGLYQLPLSPNQIVVSLVTITLFTPCIASLMVMVKERGVKEAAIVWTGTWVVAFLVGGILSQILI
ncbi:MAG: ferrous iron transport protein B [Ignavibacteriales bacterium]|nr:ferrous iron transport protein B [Ignavibacteriales bacterium]MBI3786994.1 ferrous iron transport protein B [Ignavibacteriales bacterium]